MNEQTKYFGISLGLHGILLTLLLVLTAGSVVRNEVVTIDFSLDNSPPLSEPQQVKQSRPALPACPPALPEPVRQAVAQPAAPAPSVAGKPIPTESAPQPATAAVQVTQPSAERNIERSVTTGSSVSTVMGERPVSVASNGSNLTSETGVEQVKKRYLKEHFNYIRDLIVKRLAYPPIARKMEWSGKVVLAFVVGEDGGVRSIHIRESSGYPVLDNSALNTVKSVAPFPRPPVAAEIVMPVQFRLQ